MLPKDRHLITKLRRRISILVILILILVYWIKNRYSDLDFANMENQDLIIQNIELESEIKKLNNKIDSLNSIKNEKVEKNSIQNKINTKKQNITVVKKDTLTIEKIDSSSYILIDSLKNN